MKKVVLGHGTHTSLVVTLQLSSCVYVHTGLTARALGEGTGLSPSSSSIPSFLSTMYPLDGHDILNQGIAATPRLFSQNKSIYTYLNSMIFF